MFLAKLSYSCHHLGWICEERIRAFDDLHALEQILGGDRQQVRARNLHALTVGLILNGHSLEHLWPPFMQSSLPAGPSREPSYPSRLKPDGPPWVLRLSSECLWPLLRQSCLPTWLPWKPSYLSGLEPGFPPSSCLWPPLTRSSHPARLPWEPSYLSGLTTLNKQILLLIKLMGTQGELNESQEEPPPIESP